MPRMTVRGVDLNYEIVGGAGPWVALMPGGRRSMAAVRSLAGRMAEAGYRVVIHDRRNCGASALAIDGANSEYEQWADDLHALLGELGALPVVLGGSSSGCRTSILFCLRHPGSVRAMLLWRVTGGGYASERLAFNYYTQFIEAAHEGGMEAVAETEHFAEIVEANPANRGRLMAMEVDAFVAAMGRWRRYFLEGADLPVIGATDADLASIGVPVVVIPGCDWIHPMETGRRAQRLMPDAELFEMFHVQHEVEMYPLEEWDAREDELAAAFLGFLERRL
ncbi:MAG: alpha/beta hydrolase [Defluviicoccus sp.]|nr:alpha/beta hydrolase [Defluviicoccus sp.]MDE0277035.1 alpha/beta hydrolase [Defluviicoccus sp.]